jgi:heptosyltransferase-2
VNDLPATEPREILVRAPNWAGDVVMATPGLRALRAGFPGARIRVAVRHGLEALLAGNPRIDEILPLRHDKDGLFGRLREARGLRGYGFDLGLCLPDSFSAALSMRAAGVRRVVGYARNARSPLLHQAVPLPRGAGRRVMLPRELHVLGLVEAVGCKPLGTQLELFVTEEEEEGCTRLLAAHEIAPSDRPLAALAPGASFGSSKLWPAERFARVGDALANAGAEVVLVGSPAESALAARVADAMKARAHDLTSELGLGGLKALVRRARVLVCNDAGARHVAAAFGVPCVMLLGPTSLEKTSLNLEKVRVLVADVACRPCYLRTCPIDHRCMKRIEPEQAIAAALPALAADAARSWRGDGSAAPSGTPDAAVAHGARA